MITNDKALSEVEIWALVDIRYSDIQIILLTRWQQQHTMDQFLPRKIPAKISND